MTSIEVKELFRLAKEGEQQAFNSLLQAFKPFLQKKSTLNGKMDEDCFQELNSKLIKCVQKFEFNSLNVDFENCLKKLNI